MFIKIKRREYPLLFGIKASKEIYNNYAAGGFQVEVSQLATIIYAGILNAAYRDRVNINLPFSEVFNEIELMYYNPNKSHILTGIIEEFNNSQGLDDNQEKVSEEALDWTKIERFAFGEVRLLPYDFYCMTWREFLLLSDGYREKVERESKLRWDELRLQTYVIHTHLTQKKPQPFDRWLNIDNNHKSQIERLKKKLQDHKKRELEKQLS